MESGHFRKKSGIAGNAMLYVLIGIALFAALTFILTKSGRSGKMSLEDAIIQSQSITSYADKISGAVQNVMTQNGCLASQINFNNATVAGYTNPTAPANKKCDIFDLAGGGMNFEAPPAAALDATEAGIAAFPLVGALYGQYFFTGKACVDNVGTGPRATCASDGLGNEELLLILPWVSAAVCAAINQTLENTGAMLQDSDGSFDSTKFTGTFADGSAIGGAVGTAYPMGCFQTTAAGSSPGIGYHFYYTLLAR